MVEEEEQEGEEEGKRQRTGDDGADKDGDEGTGEVGEVSAVERFCAAYHALHALHCPVVLHCRHIYGCMSNCSTWKLMLRSAECELIRKPCACMKDGGYMRETYTRHNKRASMTQISRMPS